MRSREMNFKNMIEMRGKAVSDSIRDAVRKDAETVERELGRKPRLTIVRCGTSPDQIAYERSVEKQAKTFGIDAEILAFPEMIGDSLFMRKFMELNESRTTDGILLLRPLPSHLNEGFALSCMDSQKDVDGVSPVSAAGIYLGTEGFAPCTAEAVMELLRFYGISVAGKEVVIVGRSAVVGKPLALLMLSANATVTICHSKTRHLEAVCRRADILVAAIGKPRFIRADFLKEGAVVVDVGMNTDENGKLCGDVDFEGCREKAAFMTPVPGGLGAVTTAVLMRHTAEAAKSSL